ncbi:glycosyltransferase family 2 protein [Cellulosimicrobium sp. PMB13]|uniref:glycosyltransferase family 2 protein n=1 Tax=Cellulosimicrobium sp. PMB13 TaxID=3120158 RepID=UPI003F4C7859
MSAPATTPRVRAVVVTWNGAELLRESLPSLLAQDLADGELDVLVVDNGSSDGTPAMLAAEFPTVRVVASPENLGFAGGAELGLRDLDAEYAVLLNNDARFEPDAVRRMVEVADAEPAVGAVTARILLTEPDTLGRTLVNSTGNVVRPDGAGGDRDWLAVDGTIDPDPDVFGFCGGAALLRAAALRHVGSFDPWLFLYYEDTDLSWRLRARGWTVRYCATAVAHHHHAASSDAASPLFRYYNTRNSLVVLGRHAPPAVVVRSTVRQVAAAVVHSVRRSERPAVTAARRRAVVDAVRRAPTTWRERRSLWRGARRTRAEVFRVATAQGARPTAPRPPD